MSELSASEPTRLDASDPADESREKQPSALADFGKVLGLFVLWRGLLFAFVALGITMSQRNPVEQRSADNPWQAFPNSPFWDSWARWDSGWYQMVVEKGYSFHRGEWSDTAFFPLFPYTTKLVAAITGDHWAAGLLVSNLSTLGALFFLLRIARPIVGPDGAERTLVYMLAFPATFFLSAYYSEGLFLLTTSASVYFYLQGGYIRSGLWGLLATMTRPTGIALIPALAVGMAWNVWKGRTKIRLPMVLGLLLIPCGLLLFMLLLYVKVGNPLAFVAAHGAWGRTSASPHLAFLRALLGMDWRLTRDLIGTITFLDASTALVFLALPLVLIKKCDPALPIYSLLLILIPLSTGSVKSMMRLESVAFPAFIALARLGANPRVDRAIIFGSALFLGLFNLLFANWYWVG